MKTLKTLSLTFLLGLASHSFAEQTGSMPQPTATAMQEQQAAVQTTIQTSANIVNINTAGAAELQDKLVGIGEKKAQAIVDYRTKHGAFVSIEQLTEVSGIGKSTVDKNQDRIILK